MSASSRWALVLALAGCAGNPAPGGTLPDALEAGRTAYGGWVEVEFTRRGKAYRAEGELLALSSDSIYIAGKDSLLVYSLTRLQRGRVVGYDGHPGTLTGYSALGSLTTVANGWFLVFTMPLWWVAGGISTHHAVNEMSRTIPTTEPDRLRPFARFPLGFPADLDRAAVRPFGPGGTP